MRHALLLSAALLASVPAAADQDVEHKFQSVVPSGQVRRVLIDIPTGSFTIRNGSAAHIGVSGVASRDYDGARERAWAQKVVNDTSVEVYVNGAEAIVRRKFGRNADSWRAQKFTGIDLRLELPAGVDVEFETTAGEVDVAGDFGDITVDLRAGEVDVRVPRGKVRELNASCRIGEVRTNLGTEIVSKEGIFPGRTHYFNAKGKTHVNVHVTAGEVDITLVQ
ncbi:MAG TPA: hypothetical protein VF266_00400 [Thermoanaerobaculia bacterium]